jgi:hypothetical protein
MLDIEPLFESWIEGKHLCLVCTKKCAVRALWTGTRVIVPLCEDCASKWNVYDYIILKKIKPLKLMWGIVKFKIFHPFQQPSLLSICKSAKTFKEWAEKMKRIQKELKRD